MQSNRIDTPSVYPASGAAHAVRFGNTIYTGAILPKDKSGRIVAPDDVVLQTESMLDNLRAVLASAGAGFDQVARVNCYVDPAACARLDRIYEVSDRYLRRNAHAGTVVPLTLPEAGVLVAIEAIAHVDAPQAVVSVSDAPGRAWADAVGVADKLYVSGRYGHGDTFADQARSIYDAFDAIVKKAGIAWRDVVRVHQFGVRPDLSIDQIRAARSPYLRNEEFLSTSVVCHDVGFGGSNPWPWQLVVDIEAAVGPKQYISAQGTWANPGGLHVAKVGDTVYFQAQMSRDPQGRTMFPDDPEAHTDQCCRNLDAMIKAAAIGWSDIVHARVFCKRRQDVLVARRVVDRWLDGNACARTDLVAAFFDPLATVEIELTAAV